MAAANSSNTSAHRFPLWGEVVAGIFALLLLVALAVPHFLDVDRYRGTIADAIARQTGLKVTMGKIQARLLPGVGLTVQGFHIANPAGFPEGDLLSADGLRVNVAIGPLLHRIVHVNSVNLVHPKLSLISEDNGKDNYTFPAAMPSQGAPANSSSSSV